MSIGIQTKEKYGVGLRWGEVKVAAHLINHPALRKLSVDQRNSLLNNIHAMKVHSKLSKDCLITELSLPSVAINSIVDCLSALMKNGYLQQLEPSEAKLIIAKISLIPTSSKYQPFLEKFLTAFFSSLKDSTLLTILKLNNCALLNPHNIALLNKLGVFNRLTSQQASSLITACPKETENVISALISCKALIKKLSGDALFTLIKSIPASKFQGYIYSLAESLSDEFSPNETHKLQHMYICPLLPKQVMEFRELCNEHSAMPSFAAIMLNDPISKDYMLKELEIADMLDRASIRTKEKVAQAAANQGNGACIKRVFELLANGPEDSIPREHILKPLTKKGLSRTAILDIFGENLRTNKLRNKAIAYFEKIDREAARAKLLLTPLPKSLCAGASVFDNPTGSRPMSYARRSGHTGLYRG